MRNFKIGQAVRNKKTGLSGIIKQLHPLAITVHYGNCRTEHLPPAHALIDLVPIKKTRIKFTAGWIKNLFMAFPNLLVSWEIEHDIFIVEYRFVWLDGYFGLNITRY